MKKTNVDVKSPAHDYKRNICEISYSRIPTVCVSNTSTRPESDIMKEIGLNDLITYSSQRAAS